MRSLRVKCDMVMQGGDLDYKLNCSCVWSVAVTVTARTSNWTLLSHNDNICSRYDEFEPQKAWSWTNKSVILTHWLTWSINVQAKDAQFLQGLKLLSCCHEKMIFCLNKNSLCAAHCSESSLKRFTDWFMKADLNSRKLSRDNSLQKFR